MPLPKGGVTGLSLNCTAGTHSHAVVLSKDEVDIAQITLILVDSLDGTLLCLVTLEGRDGGDAGIRLQGIGKTIMTLNGRR